MAQQQENPAQAPAINVPGNQPKQSAAPTRWWFNAGTAELVNEYIQNRRVTVASGPRVNAMLADCARRHGATKL